MMNYINYGNPFIFLTFNIFINKNKLPIIKK